MAVNNSINTNNQPLTIISGTGAINIGNDSTDKTITIGNQTGATILNILAGVSAGAINIGNDSIDKTITIGGTTSTTPFTLITNSSGVCNIGNDSIDKTITIGNATGSTSLAILGGTGSGNSINIGVDAIDHTIIIGSATGASVTSLNNNVKNIGSSSSNQTITIGSNSGSSSITFQSGGGTINPGGGIIFPYLSTSSSAVNLCIGTYYICTSGSLQTLTLPTTASIGTLIQITGSGSGGWTVAQNLLQQINSTANSTTVGILGSLSSGSRYDCVTLVCTVANTNWSIFSSCGTLTFA